MENKRANREIEMFKKDPNISNINVDGDKLTLDFEDSYYGTIKYSIEIPKDYPIGAPIVSYKRPGQSTYTTVVINDWKTERLLGGIINKAHKTKMEPFDVEGGKRRQKTRRRKTKRRRSRKSRRHRK